MDRMTNPGHAHFGQAVSNLIADTVHKVIVHTSGHVQAERVRHTTQTAVDAGVQVHASVQPLMQHLLDTGKVHPLLAPVVKLLATEKPKER